MMTQRKRFSLLGLILLALLLVIIWIIYVLFSNGSDTVDVTQDVEPDVEDVVEVIPDRPTVSEQEMEDEREERTASADVISLSKTFVERYGSYSNEADFSNLVDVLPLMSDSFASQTESFIEQSEAPEEYYGVSTSVITVEVVNEDEESGVAQVLVNTQREEAIGSPQNISVKYQEIELEYVMEGGVWKVDSANWL